MIITVYFFQKHPASVLLSNPVFLSYSLLVIHLLLSSLPTFSLTLAMRPFPFSQQKTESRDPKVWFTFF